MKMIWFTSDTHFFHKNIISYCNRPFASLNEMHAVLIRNWNDTVGSNDEVYILGDFVFGGVGRIREITAQLNGVKTLIRGNHDDRKVLTRGVELGFNSVAEPSEGSISSVDEFLLSHYPYLGKGDSTDVERFTDKRYNDTGKWLLHGHVHCHWRVKEKMINVGVDVWDYRPVSLETLKGLAQ